MTVGAGNIDLCRAADAGPFIEAVSTGARCVWQGARTD